MTYSNDTLTLKYLQALYTETVQRITDINWLLTLNTPPPRPYFPIQFIKTGSLTVYGVIFFIVHDEIRYVKK